MNQSTLELTDYQYHLSFNVCAKTVFPQCVKKTVPQNHKTRLKHKTNKIEVHIYERI